MKMVPFQKNVNWMTFSPSDGEEESPKKPLPVLSYWVCGRFDSSFAIICPFSSLFASWLWSYYYHHHHRRHHHLIFYWPLKHFTSEHQIYKYKYIYHHDDHYPRSIFVEMGLATSSLDLLQLLSNTLSYFDFAFSISSLHPPSTIIITILIIGGIGSNRQHDGEISTLFFDIQRKTLSDCFWLQTHENATFATMTLLLRWLHTIINIHIITLINIREAVWQDFPPQKWKIKMWCFLCVWVTMIMMMMISILMLLVIMVEII